MPRKRSGDLSYLEKHGAHYRVTLGVPKELQKKLGTRLKRSLGTDSLTVANAMKFAVLHELRTIIDQERELRAGKPRDVIRTAAQIRAMYRTAHGEEAAMLAQAIVEHAAEIRGPEIGEVIDPETGDAAFLYDPGRSALAADFSRVATGRATPLMLFHDEFLAGLQVKERTKNDSTRAVGYLVDFCEKRNIAPAVEAITVSVAIQFMAHLGKGGMGRDPATQKKYLTRLNCYWRWMGETHEIGPNPWAERKVPKGPSKVQERPFTAEELRLLLIGGAPAKLHDLMMIAALTGARLEVITKLKVRDCVDGGIRFAAAKTEECERDVPIHPDLVPIIERRCRGKRLDDDMFPEWPPPKKADSKRERSFKASNMFTLYRRKVGVQEMVPGQRRSLVNFHSFRRWFTTEAERVGALKNIISAIVGHKDGNITLDRYSSGPNWEQAKELIEKIRLPPLDQGPVPEKRALQRIRR
ncbi:tyrosine-type recombinase/integrase [Salinarimonas chemoclinalis]|uniref:tyrosine-type recombinase/integrase n=1 Tax=Salinarimonas chemoclinalis TaxID=3241599 RepID=UPI0035590CC2